MHRNDRNETPARRDHADPPGGAPAPNDARRSAGAGLHSGGWDRDDEGFLDPSFRDGRTDTAGSDPAAPGNPAPPAAPPAARPGDRYDASGGYFVPDGQAEAQPGGSRAGDGADVEGERGRGRDGGMPGRGGGLSAGTGAVSSDARTSGRGKGPKNFTRTDERILEDVCHALEDAEVDASNIDVRVTNGEVTLEGTVHDAAAAREAEEVAHATRGVKQCHNLLRIGAATGASTGER